MATTFPFDTLVIAKRILVSFGYVNDTEKTHKLSNNIPAEIKEIISSYNKCTGTWDPKYVDDKVMKLEGNRITSLENVDLIMQMLQYMEIYQYHQDHTHGNYEL